MESLADMEHLQVNLYYKFSTGIRLLEYILTAKEEIQSTLSLHIKFLMITTQWELVVDSAK